MTRKEILYNAYCAENSDINEHLPILKYYASLCNHITEFGVRAGKSTIALLNGCPKRMISYDIRIWKKFNPNLTAELALPETKFTFKLKNVLKTDIKQTDLLFIDTFHTYNQLKQELKLHHTKVNKWIIMHDTETFGIKGEDGKEPGLNDALNEFLEKYIDQWGLEKIYVNNNGLTIIRRI